VRRTVVDYYSLSESQRLLVDSTLLALGYDDAGYVDPGSAEPFPARLRLALSAFLAQQLNIRLPAGSEIAMCCDCDAVGSAGDMREGFDGGMRCIDDPYSGCHARYALECEDC
jgi:hypothetical protein